MMKNEAVIEAYLGTRPQEQGDGMSGNPYQDDRGNKDASITDRRAPER